MTQQCIVGKSSSLVARLLGCNLLGRRGGLAGLLERILPVDIRIPGCPPTPRELAAALLEILGARAGAAA